MILIASLVVGLLFACGVRMVLERELVRVACGTVLITNSSVLLILAGSFQERGEALSVHDGWPVTDPVLQSLALTAIVIGFAVSALLLTLVHRTQRAHGSLRTDRLVEAELKRVHATEKEEDH
ncbi:NADH-ubiquinone/plastoquinone oxidoreductase family protein [Corallococcus coralloides DSM 2259]|uniref:NADH-ubiquinone/plastoquinone oxidoreductase family protein n=1 Tax=Corallococcus coralloides (strain ATCC 25202 / DSM 2259 / NBRC 100086 / M2) TaxID=1144275 RepID=H8MY35_CORCM|nr:sodium:proton antiporter [Corallococcus coralloides]AFE09447.1 NADH-ubiquinone/plastoquinone oxidoreductase family protein [Corallococcus coralloides DSM 2259]